MYNSNAPVQDAVVAPTETLKHLQEAFVDLILQSIKNSEGQLILLLGKGRTGKTTLIKAM
jgi:ABC-type branched-subunit amino acid transport system ATPase component